MNCPDDVLPTLDELAPCLLEWAHYIADKPTGWDTVPAPKESFDEWASYSLQANALPVLHRMSKQDLEDFLSWLDNRVSFWQALLDTAETFSEKLTS